MPARRKNIGTTPMFAGAVDAPTFKELSQYWIDRYFALPSYYLVPDVTGTNASRVCPLINIYLLDALVAGLGGLAAADAAFDDFRARAAAAGFACVHVQVEGFGLHGLANATAALAQLRIHSVTDYCFQVCSFSMPVRFALLWLLGAVDNALVYAPLTTAQPPPTPCSTMSP